VAQGPAQALELEGAQAVGGPGFDGFEGVFAGGEVGRQGRVSREGCSFLKKEPKKFCPFGRVLDDWHAHRWESLFCFFFLQKKEDS
jgi:hypothetical protein